MCALNLHTIIFQLQPNKAEERWGKNCVLLRLEVYEKNPGEMENTFTYLTIQRNTKSTKRPTGWATDWAAEDRRWNRLK